MRNTFSIQIDATDQYDRMWLVIDGEKRFQLSSECLVDSILSPDGASEWLLLPYRKSELERVVDYGFCQEDCCPSKLATVHVTDEIVSWTNIRETTSTKILNAEGFAFDRKQYDSEINRVLTALVYHYRGLYVQHRWPQQPPKPQPEHANEQARNT